MNRFSKNSKIPLEHENEAEILAYIGSGGQGEVYKVSVSGKEYAMKWYLPRYMKKLEEKQAKKWFKNNIAENIKSRPPSDKFIWPEFLTKEIEGSFGYVMRLLPSNFIKFEYIYNMKDKDGNKVAFKDSRASVNSAINIAEAFKELHRKGYVYMDLNDGNFHIDINSGDILVIDNDNVTGIPKFNLGMLGFIAPELARGDRGVTSSFLTDAHSLAVVLFRLFMRHDPLMGKNYAKSILISAAKEYELYAENPIFIFDPDDSSNHPVINIHTNPLKLWPLYPDAIRNAFIKTFALGMKQPEKRLSEVEWLKLLIQFRDSMIICPDCGVTMLIKKAAQMKNNVTCWKCSRTYPFPGSLEVKDYRVLLFPGNELLYCHAYDDDENFKNVIGKVFRNDKDINKWGIMNMSNDTWSVKRSDGSIKTATKGKIITIADGTEIEFPQGHTAIIKG